MLPGGPTPESPSFEQLQVMYQELLRSHAESETRLKLILDSAPVGIIQLDEERRYILANVTYQRFLGYSLEELRGMTMFQVTHPEDLPVTKQVSENFSIPNFWVRRLEKRYITKSGDTVWGLVTSQQVKNPFTGRMNLFTVIEDITELKKREQELKRAEAEIAHFFSAALDLMLVADMNGFIRRVNAAATSILGYSQNELVARSCWDFVHPEDLKQAVTEIESLQKGIPSLRFECRVLAKGGNYRLLSWNAAPDLAQGVFFATGRDITDRKADELKMAYSSKMASLGEMAGGLAHEVNNPLAIILGKVTNLQAQLQHSGADLEQVREELRSIEKTGHRIAKIIRGLRSFSRDADADPMVNVTVSRVIEDTLELCAERFRNREIHLTVECEPGLAVQGRPSQLSQVLMNLLSNSYDAVEASREPWIRIEAKRSHNRCLIAVEDCGRGIAPAVREKMMQPFFTTKEVGRGVGLGLSISKGIVEDHGGQLRYDESSGHTRFVIELALA